AYADGLDTTAALKKACKVERAAFEKGYRAYLEEVVKALAGGKAPEKKRTFEEVKAAHERNLDDLETAATLAEMYLGRDPVKARQLAEGVLEKKKNHPRASLVLSRLARRAGDAKQELALLEGALDRKNPDGKVLQALGKLYYDASQFDKAAEV